MNKNISAVLLKKAEETVRLHKMTDGVNGITVAFSGGADSTVLLDMLLRLKNSGMLNGISLSAFHVNHGIRGEEAYRDEEFCRAFCENHGVTFDSIRLDVPAYADANGMGLEEAARKLRYGALFDFCKKNGSDAVATAHHADDNLETVLFRLTRGTGAKGLCGIPPVREENGIRIIRPLIRISKSEITQYADNTKLEFVTDSTNSDTDYARNRIRTLVVPELRKINPNITDAVSRLCEQMCNLENENGDDIGKKLVREYNAFAKNTLFCDTGIPMLEYVHLKGLTELYKSGAIGSEITLPGGIRAIKNRDGIKWETGGGIGAKLNARTKPDSNNTISEFRLYPGLNFFPNESNGYSVIAVCEKENNFSEIYLAGKRKDEISDDVFHILRELAEKIIRDGINIYKLSIYRSLNSDKLNGDVFVRFRKSGDTVLCGKMHKKVKKLLSEKRISEKRRDFVPLICDKSGILWIPQVALRDGFSGSDGDITLYYIHSV